MRIIPESNKTNVYVEFMKVSLYQDVDTVIVEFYTRVILEKPGNDEWVHLSTMTIPVKALEDAGLMLIKERFKVVDSTRVILKNPYSDVT